MALYLKAEVSTTYAVSGLVLARRVALDARDAEADLFSYRNLCELLLFWLNLDS